MGYAGAPSRGPSTTRSRAPAQGTGRGPVILVAILVAVMLVVAGFSLYSLLPGSRPPRSFEEDGRLVVEGDVVWEGVEGIVDLPTEVRRWGRLTIRDCDLQVPLERMVIDEWNWFYGYPDSDIVVEDSAITIVADPALDDMVYLDVDWYHAFDFELRTAMMWRAVDLGGTEMPELTFDGNPLGRHGDLMVTVQPSPGEVAELVETFTFEEGDPAQWETHTVDLSAYAGDIVGLSIATVDRSMSGLMLKDVRVTDGGADPPMDAFPTGNPIEDRWYGYGINPMSYHVRDLWTTDLFCSEGDLVFRDSTLTAPHLPREVRTNVGDGSKMRLIGNDGVGFNVLSLSRGGGVYASGGSILIEDCLLDNVTVSAIRSQVDIVRTAVVADREQVTLFSCWGSLVGSTFRSEYGPYSFYYPGYRPANPDLWSVSIWGYAEDFWGPSTLDPFAIEGCDFRGSMMGLELAQTRVTLRSCTFTDIEWVAIWDHETQGLGSWEDIDQGNEFTGCSGTLLFRTHNCTIDFHHDTRSFNDWCSLLLIVPKGSFSN